MTREEKYDKVNEALSLKELGDVIRSFADEDGMIMGRTRKFDAERMAIACQDFKSYPVNTLTREFGIRQQAMMINYYGGDMS